ncbi:universal stress protein [Kitasatospora sp. MAP5-34]|uniref:universal stress protein n=1 Tax=Kitasatospora sp. MAP5-34 TaxID=3035102 RepID=UPI002474DD06|nr:universal stress protein [Kitasatospora sp. MAP5-34]MDH6574719.1 nucleotide-binding universal stress UspA family protein [Kitasatospora sp. MAP5-34]
MADPVIVGVDDPASTGDAADWAADEAHLRGTRLHLVHAWLWEPHQAPPSLDALRLRRAGEEALATLAERVAARHPDLEVSSGVVDSSPREALVALSAAAALLVLGSRGSGGFPGLLVGSTSLHVTAHAACPVVVFREAASKALADDDSRDGLVVGVHGREPSDELLAFAFETAQRRHLPLRAVHAWSYPLVLGPGHEFPPVYEESHVAAAESRLLAEVMSGWREKYSEVPVIEDVVRSGPAKHLVELSETHQLVVVGRHGSAEGPFRRIGSVSQAVVHHAHCPVAVVPPGWPLSRLQLGRIEHDVTTDPPTH